MISPVTDVPGRHPEAKLLKIHVLFTLLKYKYKYKYKYSVQISFTFAQIQHTVLG